MCVCLAMTMCVSAMRERTYVGCWIPIKAKGYSLFYRANRAYSVVASPTVDRRLRALA